MRFYACRNRDLFELYRGCLLLISCCERVLYWIMLEPRFMWSESFVTWCAQTFASSLEIIYDSCKLVFNLCMWTDRISFANADDVFLMMIFDFGQKFASIFPCTLCTFDLPRIVSPNFQRNFHLYRHKHLWKTHTITSRIKSHTQTHITLSSFAEKTPSSRERHRRYGDKET